MNKVEIQVKTFDELTKTELYELLLLRAQVFIVEQQGQYLDLDRIDYQSLHLFCQESDGQVLGYLRLFAKTDESGTVQLGRMVTRDRRTGLGRHLVETAKTVAKSRFGAGEIYLTGRPSALGFYEKLGFRAERPRPAGQGYYELRCTL